MRQFIHIFRIDFADIADAESVSVRYFARIDGVASVFDVLIHFAEGEISVFRIEERRDNRSLICAADIRFNAEFSHFFDENAVVFAVAFMARRDAAFSFQFFERLSKSENNVRRGSEAPFAVLAHRFPTVREYQATDFSLCRGLPAVFHGRR